MYFKGHVVKTYIFNGRGILEIICSNEQVVKKLFI